jgi:hypothetical protein
MEAPTRLRHRAMSALWSGFLAAAVLEMVVFAWVDPGDLRWFGGETLAIEPRAVYTLAFFVFWAISAVGAALALLLCSPPDAASPPGAVDARAP